MSDEQAVWTAHPDDDIDSMVELRRNGIGVAMVEFYDAAQHAPEFAQLSLSPRGDADPWAALRALPEWGDYLGAAQGRTGPPEWFCRAARGLVAAIIAAVDASDSAENPPPSRPLGDDVDP